MGNHTSTHLLNFALRDILGDGCDQRGSLVVEDRFRFDFSYHQKLSGEELQRLDEIVNDIIKQELPVYTTLVKYDIAQTVSGVRHMFGEKYPDPVRVVSVGADIAEILKNPTDPVWTKYSMEYCGGTHVSNTKNILSFTVVEDFGKGSGERRITALSGDLAKQAHSDYERLSFEMDAVEHAGDEELRQKVLEFEDQLINTHIPAYLKYQLRDRLEEMKTKSDLLYKEKVRLMKKSGDQLVQEIINLFSDEAVKFVVFEYDVDGNNKLLVDTVNQILDSVNRDIALMLVSPFPSKNRIIYAASVKSGLHGSLTSQAWVQEVSNNFGGKGGGKPAFAQGFHEKEDQVEATLEVARDFAAKYLN